MLRKIKYPILFQGNIKRKHYFEGWYYKQVSKDEKRCISFIPGISLFEGDYHSFVQYIYVSVNENNKRTMETGYLRFPIEAFKFRNNPFTIEIGENIFSQSMISVKIKDHKINIQGTLKLGLFTPIEKSIVMPNIMGFFAYIPKMECYHGVISMNHSVSGSLTINDREINFNNGKGYIEKDWGTSFPKEYIWIQCNNFKSSTTSIICSIADIPFLKRSFKGFICNLVVGEKQYRFATYNNSKMKIKNLTKESIKLILENSEAILNIEGISREPGGLIAPQKGKMQKNINEELSGEVTVYLYDKQSKVVYEDAGRMAGIEIVSLESLQLDD